VQCREAARSGCAQKNSDCVLQTVKYTRNGRAYFFQTPHLGSTAAAAAMAALYIKANKDWYFVAENPALVKGT
jgi:hypothetical protein